MACYGPYSEIKALVEKHRPDLVGIFPSTTSLLSEMGSFLDDHFPIEGGWGTRTIEGSGATLRYMLEGDAK